MKVRIILIALGIILLVGASYRRNKLTAPSSAKVIGNIERNLARQIEILKNRIDTTSVTQQPLIFNSKPYFAFIVSDSLGITQWNTTNYLPNPNLFLSDTLSYHQAGNNHWLVYKKTLNDGKYITGYLYLQSGFPIQNQYLKAEINSSIFPDDGVSFNIGGEVFPIQYKGKVLFVISIAFTSLPNLPDAWSWILLIFGIACLSVGLWHLTINNQSFNRWVGVLSWFILLLVIRLVMVYGEFPGSHTGMDVFDPKLFASSNFNDSIANLFLNTIALLLVSLVAYRKLNRTVFSSWHRKSVTFRIFVASGILIIAFASQLLPFLYVETVYHNSAINLDFSQKLFTHSIRLIAILSILLSGAVGFIILLLCFRLASRVLQFRSKDFVVSLSITAIVFFAYHLLTHRHYEAPIILGIVNLLILFLVSIRKEVRNVIGSVFSLLLFELIVFSLQCGLEIKKLSETHEEETMRKFASNFLIERDVLAEYLLGQAYNDIGSDIYIQQKLANPFYSLKSIEHKIRHTHLNPYLNRYQVNIYFFDNHGVSLQSNQKLNLNDLTNSFIAIDGKSNDQGLYIIKSPSYEFSKKYLLVIPLKYRLSTYVVIEVGLRHMLPKNVFPKLLVDNRFGEFTNSEKYSYAIYNEGHLTSTAGEFNYSESHISQQLTNPILYHDHLHLAGFAHIGVEDVGGQVSIVSVKSYGWFNVLTNFSFYFLFGTLFIAIGSLFNFSPLSFNESTSYSMKLQIYVYTAILLPLTILSLIILRIDSISEQERIETSNRELALNIATNMSRVFSDSTLSLEEEIAEEAQALGMDISVYSTTGYLMASSQPGIFTNQLISRQMNMEALWNLLQGRNSYTNFEQIGNLTFSNTYASIRNNDTGEVLGVISLPFFLSQETAESELINLISNILAVFVVVGLAFYIVSLLALNWLTSPFKVIAATLHRTTLSGQNRKLEWQSKDEIGSMIKEYNRMIDNLERSKEDLKKTQREATWREMARQVAHEIKNPLTPIKLTLQRLEKSLHNENLEKEQSIQSIKNVLNQVDILNDIASSFSAFAQMPEPIMEKISITKLIQETVEFHQNKFDGTIEYIDPSEKLEVMADKKILSRIFSNVILNAFQAKKDDVDFKLIINILRTENDCLISFSDNGLGMEKEIRDKVFIPYFSTKQSGTGLGLAISKQGIEQMGGRIWCESTVGQGSKFFIALPLAK